MHPARPPRRARLRLAGVCLLAAFSLAGPTPAGAQEPAADPLDKPSIWPSREFVVPFKKLSEQQATQIRELRLYQKKGAEWEWINKAGPADSGFDCRTDRDGVFLFGVQAVGTDGKNVPTVENLRPTLRVIVDTEPPVVQLRAVRQDGPGGVPLIGVAWDVFDATTELASLKLDFRLVDPRTNAPAGEWRPLGGVDQRAKWQRLWKEEPKTHLEVRLSVQDHFKRPGEATVIVSNLPGGTLGGGAAPFAADPGGKGGTPAVKALSGGPPTIYRNKTSFTLKFQVSRKGPSGLQNVELWWAAAGDAKWKVADQPDGKFVREADEATGGENVLLRFEAPGEGRYGFVLVGVSGSGVRNREPPKAGDAPDLWAEVIVKPPTIRKFDVKTGKGAEARKLYVTWQVDDKHLREDPIQLEYAATAESATWEPIAFNLPNTGKFEWVAPDKEPYNFVVRLRVIDKATNEASQLVPGVIVDPTPPEFKFIDAMPDPDRPKFDSEKR